MKQAFGTAAAMPRTAPARRCVAGDAFMSDTAAVCAALGRA